MSSRAVAIALHDLRLTLADRAAVAWLFVLPIVFATFFGLVMGGGSDPRTARAGLTVDDCDHGPVAVALVAALAGEGLDVAAVAPPTDPPAAPPLRLLRIPAGTSAAVLAGEQVVLDLAVDADASSEATLLVQARLTAAVARVLGRLVELRRADPAAALDPAALTAPGGADLVRVASSWAGAAAPPPAGVSQSVPGNAVMLVLLVALTYSAAALSREREGGLLRRLATTPASPTEIVVGKIGGRLAVALVQVTVLVAVAVVGGGLVGLELGDPLAVWVVLVVYTLAVAPLGVAVGGAVRDPDRAASIGVVLTMAMASLGGCWWPLEVVPPAMQKVALLLPTGWAMTALHGVISFGRSLPEVLPALAVLLAFAGIFTVAAVRTLRVD